MVIVAEDQGEKIRVILKLRMCPVERVYQVVGGYKYKGMMSVISH